MARVSKIPTITEDVAFYGYITGLGVERDTGKPEVPARLFATFEYNGEVKVWLVPDAELFKELSEHLNEMAVLRELGDYGYNKVWIERRGGDWHVDLP